MKIYTIGHSTRSLDEFVTILESYGVTYLVDIRTVPKSKHNPQFGENILSSTLPERGIGYCHLSDLGGLRYSKKDNMTNAGWRNKSFRGYADYMQTENFQRGIRQLLDVAEKYQVVIMCAEAVPWRCHRSMVGDALLVRGHEVIDIFDNKKAEAEKLTDFARVKGTKITYPAYADKENV